MMIYRMHALGPLRMVVYGSVHDLELELPRWLLATLRALRLLVGAPPTLGR